jgi:hypothetical protein
MCCGKSRAQWRSSAIPRVAPPTLAPQVAGAGAPSAKSPSVTFEYIGRTTLLVRGPVSKRSYHFDKPGRRLEIDARDSVSLVTVPMLRRFEAAPSDEQ